MHWKSDERTLTSNENPLLRPMRDLYRAYVRLLESGKERIEFHGGTCDSVEQMERGDPYLRAATIAMQAAQIEQRHSHETLPGVTMSDSPILRTSNGNNVLKMWAEELRKATTLAYDSSDARSLNRALDTVCDRVTQVIMELDRKANEPSIAGLPHTDTCGLKYGGERCTCGLGNEAHGNETGAGNQPDPYVSGLAQAGIRAERDRRIIERHVRWHDEALRLLQQVNTGYEGEWPEIADFVRRSTARIEQSSSEKASEQQSGFVGDQYVGPPETASAFPVCVKASPQQCIRPAGHGGDCDVVAP
jgi:hypothetical protein